MKINKFGYFALGGLVMAGLLFAGLVKAEENGNKGNGGMMRGLGGMVARVFKHKEEAHATGSTLEVHIYDDGSVLVRGAKVTGVSGDVISAHTDWDEVKLNWAVDTGTLGTAKFFRRLGGISNIDEVSVGDMISFHGKLVTSTSSPLTVNADAVKDWSVITQKNGGDKENGEKEKDEKTVRDGTIKSVSGSTLVVTMKDKDFTVHTDGDTAILGKTWLAINFSALAVGDKVQVYGEVDGTTIEATVVRDLDK
jgi:hypothetical protein